ncbi:Ppx/GppA family phosphatase [Altererythrobacter salegens]|uniref:Ppx/GppA family phosphatase n=1 Tax=Croceibacterium salegens TaxID=1737568 RepID=A0A6I4SY57_9SPHN|nr:Ppx/GppA family phosphatase [Croceibacterium salegens]
MSSHWPSGTLELDGAKPDRAVVDIGSNTVRLVIYSGPPRAPNSFLNEKVVAKLGRDIGDTGLIPDKSAELALAALRRYNALITDLGVQQVDVVATAAVRDAKNGGEFLERVRKLGLDARLLSGDEEARASATGVIAAFPDAHGVVADLGGGSLELVSVENGQDHHGESLSIGTLRLGALRKKGSASFKRTVHRAFDNAGWAAAHPGPLYMVGGTWRAFAKYAMLTSGHPLSDPHWLQLPVEEADKIAKKLVRTDPETLREMGGITNLRAGALPDAAALLRVMLAELAPTELVFSSWGLREGILYQRLPELARRQDPLLAGMAYFTAPRGASISKAAMIAGWTASVANGDGAKSERLRLAATLLAQAAARLEPNIRMSHALNWALEKRWIGLDMPGRARIAAALVGACDKPALPSELLALADEKDLHEALGWGLAIRLCRRLGGGSRTSLASSSLTVEGKTVVLDLDSTGAELLGEPVETELKNLAGWLGMDAEIRVDRRLPKRANLTLM